MRSVENPKNANVQTNTITLKREVSVNSLQPILMVIVNLPGPNLGIINIAAYVH